jgi:DNA-binding LacI/PurR family transcriptional regulator
MEDDVQSNLTISDIAERAGVSVTTVSRILNNRPDVSAKTTARVKAVMADLGYQPQVSARRLASGRSSVIAVLPHATSSELGSVTYEYLTGVVDGAEADEFSVNLLPRGTSREKLKALLGTGQFDGLVLLQVQTNDWRVDTLRQNGRPFVLVGRTEDTAGISYVDVDLIAAARMMVDRLVENGHKAITFIGNTLSLPVRRFSASLLLDGYDKGMRAHDLTPRVLDTGFDIDSIVGTIVQGLAKYPQTSCFFIGGHVAMPQIMNRLRDRGVSVPSDVSLVSILPESTADITMPRVTTIDLPGRELGQHAARILINHVLGRSEIRQELLPPQITWRDSVARLVQ